MLGIAVGAASCGSSGTEPGTAASLIGSWHYVGAQTSGQRIAYDGIVTITKASGSGFTGDFNLQSSTPQGQVLQVNGVISGRASSTVVDFDLQFTDDVRRHVGDIAGDSITGSWANDDLSSIGSFTMVRKP
jgi:hypothetical protein